MNPLPPGAGAECLRVQAQILKRLFTAAIEPARSYPLSRPEPSTDPTTSGRRTAVGNAVRSAAVSQTHGRRQHRREPAVSGRCERRPNDRSTRGDFHMARKSQPPHPALSPFRGERVLSMGGPPVNNVLRNDV